MKSVYKSDARQLDYNYLVSHSWWKHETVEERRTKSTNFRL